MDEQGDRLQVSLLNPQHGWIEVIVSTAEEEFKEAVSCIPNDFILELATALSLALQGVDGVAIASCEPVTYEWTFSEVVGTNLTHLQIVKYPDRNKNRKSGCVILSVQSSRLGIVLPFLRALRSL